MRDPFQKVQGYEVDTQGGLPLRRILKGNRYSSVGRSWN
jgi:hypothetical protein